jgi:protein-tyrosine phosphatase
VREDFRILIVCTANIVRSPMAEMIAKAMLRSSSCPILVTSAGTRARAGHPMAPHALTTLRDLGLDGSAHHARPLDNALVSDADLILTMETEHRGSAVTMEPAAMHKTFTLLEFAHLTGGRNRRHKSDTVGRAHAVVRAVAGRRGAPARRHPVEIADPYGGPPEEYHRCAREMGASLSHVLGELLGPR